MVVSGIYYGQNSKKTKISIMLPLKPSMLNNLFSSRKRLSIILSAAALLVISAVVVYSLLNRSNVTNNDTGNPTAADGTSKMPEQPVTDTGKLAEKKPPATSPGATGTTPGNSSSNTNGGSGSTGTPPPPPAALVTLHYTVNVTGNVLAAVNMGFNLLDVSGSGSNPQGVNATVNALPAGARAIIWVGNLGNSHSTPCPAYGFTTAQFKAQVDALKNNSKVFGYLLADEPHPTVCTDAAADIRERADYIRTNAPNQYSFIVVIDGTSNCGGTYGCEYAALQPANTHVDYFGIDPYPCHYDNDEVTPIPCDHSKITARVNAAIANGIPQTSIVPVFQTFGQAGRTDGTDYYRMPSAAELSSMMNTWASLVPNPAFDYAYGFGVQCESSCPAPQAIINTPDIHPVIISHNQ